MKRLAIPLILLIAASCTPERKEADTSAYTHEIYTPEYAGGFALKSLPDDTTMLALEVYKPDTTRIIIPQGGFGKVACMSSTYVGMLAEAGSAERIAGVSNVSHVTNPAVRNSAVEIGYEGAMDYEALIASGAELTLIYGIGGETPVAAKLEELGLPYVYISDFEEQDPLGRAEWLVALGALTGKDMAARFREIAAAYEPAEGNTPVMLNAPYGGAWFIPGKEGYMSRLVSDAGGEITVRQPSGVQSQPVDMEDAIPALERAEIWLNPGTSAEVAHARFRGKAWNQRPDFFESGAVRPDKVLSELKLIFKGCEADTLHYFQRLR